MKLINDLCKELKENTYYQVKVILYPGNVEHEAILYTGFSNSGYRVLWEASYEGIYDDREFIKQKSKAEVIKELFTKTY